MKFTIHGKLPSENDIINTARRNYHMANAQKQSWQETIMWEARALKPVKKYPVCVVITYTEKQRRRDVDGVQGSKKMILDALANMGILENDSRRYVGNVYCQVQSGDEYKADVEIFEGRERMSIS